MPHELRNVLRILDPIGFTYYLGTLTPAEIKQLTFVPVVTQSSHVEPANYLNERAENGYQRAGDEKRMDEIKRFVMRRPACVIPPVLLSARGRWTFMPSKGDTNFGILQADELAAIVDGQHRLGGLWLLARDEKIQAQLKQRPIPFMVLHDLDVDSEKQEFVDINDNQKGVKKSLLRYLNRDDAFSGMAAHGMMEDEESVFKGRIDIQKKQDWTIILFGAAQECVDLMFSKDFTSVKHFSPEQRPELRESAIEFVLRYWRTVSEAMPQLWADMEKMPPIGAKKTKERPGTKGFRYRLLEETGIRAMSRIGADLFSLTWIEGIRAPAWDAIEAYLRELASRDRVLRVFSKPSMDPGVISLDPELRSTGKAGVSAMYRHLKDELNDVVRQLGSAV